MTVYVDDARIPAVVGRIRSRWSHLTGDSRDELHAFAASIGQQRSWFQLCKRCEPQGCHHFHYDLTDSQRERAIRAGAKPVTVREMGELIAARNPRRMQPVPGVSGAGDGPREPGPPHPAR